MKENNHMKFLRNFVLTISLILTIYSSTSCSKPIDTLIKSNDANNDGDIPVTDVNSDDHDNDDGIIDAFYDENGSLVTVRPMTDGEYLTPEEEEEDTHTEEKTDSRWKYLDSIDFAVTTTAEKEALERDIERIKNGEFNNRPDVLVQVLMEKYGVNINKYAYLLDDMVVYNEHQKKDIIEKYQKIYVDYEREGHALIEYMGEDDLRHTGYISLVAGSGANISRPYEILPSNYLEVDISDQQLYMYFNNKDVFSTPVITGKENGKKDATPTDLGYFAIYEKTKATYLVGINEEGDQTYRSYVDYWMPFNNQIGFHDAEYHVDEDGNEHGWRNTEMFNEKTYKKNGSHGCVNMLNDAAKFIYESTEVGTKVLVHR